MTFTTTSKLTEDILRERVGTDWQILKILTYEHDEHSETDIISV